MERLVIQRAYDLDAVKDTNVSAPMNTKSPLVNASKGQYRLVQESHSSLIDVDLIWDLEKYAGLIPLHHDAIVRHFITSLFKDYALLELNNQKVLEIPFFTEYERNGFV
jgi:hypothetical protein